MKKSFSQRTDQKRQPPPAGCLPDFLHPGVSPRLRENRRVVHPRRRGRAVRPRPAPAPAERRQRPGPEIEVAGLRQGNRPQQPRAGGRGDIQAFPRQPKAVGAQPIGDRRLPGLRGGGGLGRAQKARGGLSQGIEDAQGLDPVLIVKRADRPLGLQGEKIQHRPPDRELPGGFHEIDPLVAGRRQAGHRLIARQDQPELKLDRGRGEGLGGRGRA